MTLTHRLGALVAVATIVASAAGCGGGSSGFTDESASKIAGDAVTAMQDLHALRLTGDLTNDGQKITLDIQVDDQKDCTGSFSQGDGTAQVLGVDGKIWFKPDEAFWRATAGASADSIITLVGDKWVVLPAGSASFNQFCDLNQLLDQLLTSKTKDKTYSKGKVSQVGGKDAVAVTAMDADGESIGYVLVDSPHYLVKVERTKGASAGTVAFSDFDKTVDVTAPAAGDQIDLSSITS